MRETKTVVNRKIFGQFLAKRMPKSYINSKSIKRSLNPLRTCGKSDQCWPDTFRSLLRPKLRLRVFKVLNFSGLCYSMIQGAVKCEKKFDKSSVRIPPGDGVFNGGKSIRFCVFTTHSLFRYYQN